MGACLFLGNKVKRIPAANILKTSKMMLCCHEGRLDRSKCWKMASFQACVDGEMEPSDQYAAATG